MILETKKYKGHTIEIHTDDDPIDPRGDDNLGTVYYKHRDYRLGDEKITGDIIEWLEGMLSLTNKGEYSNERKNELESLLFEKYIGFPFSVYEHSGITISEGVRSGWDSGQAGYFLVSREDAVKEYGVKNLTKKIKENAMQCLRWELEAYDRYLRGEAYGYMVDDGEESCWNYDTEEYAMKTAKETVDYMVKNERKIKAQKLKAFIKHHVPLLVRQDNFCKA